MAKHKKQEQPAKGSKSGGHEKAPDLGAVAELQRALHMRGKVVGIQVLAGLTQVERTALSQWADAEGEPFPRGMAEKLDGSLFDAQVGAAGNTTGLSKMQKQILVITESIIALVPQVKEAELKVDAAKKTLTQERKTYEKLVEQNTKLCMKLRDASTGQLQGELPFDFDEPKYVPQEVRSGAEKPKGTALLAQVGADMEALRDRKLGDFAKETSKGGFNLTATIISKLGRAKIKTLGEMKDQMATVEETLTTMEYERAYKFIEDFPIVRDKSKGKK